MKLSGNFVRTALTGPNADFFGFIAIIMDVGEGQFPHTKDSV